MFEPLRPGSAWWRQGLRADSLKRNVSLEADLGALQPARRRGLEDGKGDALNESLNPRHGLPA